MGALIQGLDTLLDDTRNTGLRELRELLAEVLGGPQVSGRLIEQRRLSRERVFRLRFELGAGAPAHSGSESSGSETSGGETSGGGLRSLIVKRLPVERSLRERLAITSWLPRTGFAGRTATLVGVAAERHAGQVWHVYADLGDCTLRQASSDAGKVRAAVELIAAVHTRFVGHPLLAECRLVGVDLGTGFFAASIADAVSGLEAMTRLGSVHGERRDLVERLLQRLGALADERFDRTQEVADLGWPETLQHGDLWTTNVLVLPGGAGTAEGASGVVPARIPSEWASGSAGDVGLPGIARASALDPSAALDVRLIDWDHAGVGPALYDLSTFLRQFPASGRPAIVDAYRERVARANWAWPGDAAFNRIAETAEMGRYANCAIWRTIVALDGDAAATPDWVFEDLAEIEVWFQQLTPLLAQGEPENPDALQATMDVPLRNLVSSPDEEKVGRCHLPPARDASRPLVSTDPVHPSTDWGNQELRGS